jgi:hypothetical protein
MKLLFLSTWFDGYENDKIEAWKKLSVKYCLGRRTCK